MSGFGGRLAYFVAGAVAAVLAMLFLDSAWASTVRLDYPTVFVRTEEIEAREPDIENPTVVERIIYRTIPPAGVAIARGGAADAVSEFCRPVVVSTSDTVEVVDTLFLVRSGTVAEPPLLAPWRPGLFRATGPTNAGDLVERSYRPRGSFAFEVSGDSMLVRQGRFAGARDAFETVSTYWTLVSAIYLALRIR